MLQTVIQSPSWWKRRTSLERKLLLLTVIVIILATAIAASSITLLILGKPAAQRAEGNMWENPNFNSRKGKSHSDFPPAEPTSSILPSAIIDENLSIKQVHQKEVREKNVCQTQACSEAAAMISQNMNQSVDPCDDFYDFACGNFVEKTIIPEDKTSVTSFSQISDKLRLQLRTLVEDPIRDDDIPPVVTTKTLYQSCMNEALIATRGHQPFTDILENFGGWPVIEEDKWKPENFDWKETIYKFRGRGYSVDYLLDFSIGVDPKNSTVRTIDIDQGVLGLNREFLSKGLDDKIVKAYYEYQVDLAVMLGANRTVAEKELKESLFFEMQLANITLPPEERRNISKLYNPMTIGEMQQKFPSIPWREYINRLLPKEIQINDSEVVVVDVPSYIKHLENLLSKTPKRVVANYLMWRVSASSVSYLTNDLRDRQLQYSKVVTGKEKREDRWKECVDLVSGSMSLAVGSMYIKKFFRKDAKSAAQSMVKDIREEFNKILQEVNWMDDYTKKHALEKAATMTSHIAYPEELLDDSKLIAFYAPLKIDSTTYLENILNLAKFGMEFSFGRLRQPVDKNDWISHGRPAVVNAFYSGIENSIQFPAGILQGIFFSSERPKYLNYGAIGYVIGHEITHGFDDQGRQFDKDGNLVDWWAKPTEQKFLERAQCIIKQYAQYRVKEVGLNLNGINTQGENIADNGGIKEAYRAYVEWEKRNGEEAVLPGLPYNSRQLFWLSAANTWCSKYRPEALKVRIITGVHSPGKYRVIGPFSNMPEFAKDFNCPLGTNMNSVNKCTVW